MASWSIVIQDDYPSGSLACKLFKQSVLDCSQRGLSVVPSIDKQNATSVDLTDNKIKVISPTAFSGQIQLKSIDFTRNQLVNITGSPFADLGSLVNLNLSNSLLSYLASSSFVGLEMLEILNISFNALNELPHDVFRDLHGLKILDLAFNQFTTMPNSALPPLRNLTKLFLHMNPIESITLGTEFELLDRLDRFTFTSMDYKLPPLTNTTFQHFTRNPLSGLWFTWNPFTDAEEGVFETLEHIEYLNTGPFGFTERLFSIPSKVKTIELTIALLPSQSILTRNYFMALSNLNNSLTKLRLFFISRAPDVKIEDFAFKWFPSLIQLELIRYGNQPVKLANYTLYGLNKLENLSLSKIMLTEIPSVAFKAFAQSGSLRRLDLSGNALTGHFPDDAFASVTSLEHLDMSYNPISTILKWIETLTNLTCLLLNGGNKGVFISTHWNEPMYSLIEMRFDGLLNDEGLPGNGEIILSKNAPNLEMLNVANTENIYRLSTIRNLTSLRGLDVSGSLTTLTEDNLFKQWSSIFFPNLTKLKFTRNGLKTMTELNLYKTTPRVEDLDLSMNVITAVDRNIALLLNLQHLNLNDNQISSLENLYNIVHLKSLKLARNVISFVSATFVKSLTESKLEVLDISNNPFECTCAIRPFQNWILGDKQVYLEPNLYRCESPETYSDISLTQVQLDCRSYFGMHVAIATCCSLFAALIAILAWRYRWYLRYKFFLLLNRHRMRYEDIDRENNPFEMVELPYDAFVSYAHQNDYDLNWVLDEMKPNLEEGPEPMRLCIGQARDFLPGSNLFDSITDAIHRSHKTIVVLSPNYVDSELCYFEAQQAWKRLLEESRDVLILILLEPIPDDKMTVWMRQLLCKKGYLRWPHNRAGQQLFWRCVREKIKKRTLVNRRYDRGFNA